MAYFTDLKKELENDLKLNQVVLKQKQEERPQILIKWLWRYAEAQKEFMFLGEERTKIKNKMIERIKGISEVKLNKMALDSMAEATDELKNFDKDYKSKKNELELLQECVTAVKNYAFDIKSLIEVIKLEKI